MAAIHTVRQPIDDDDDDDNDDDGDDDDAAGDDDHDHADDDVVVVPPSGRAITEPWRNRDRQSLDHADLDGQLILKANIATAY